MHPPVRKVVIIGPESTGKSTLCAQLAEHYDTCWCPEFARSYLTQNGMSYTYEDLLIIAKGQLEMEDRLAAEARNGFYFIDTDMQVMKVWCEVAFQNCPTWILKQIAQRHYDFILLPHTDLPWAHDELREYPDPAFRNWLFRMYHDMLVNGVTPWSGIWGTDAQRLQMATGILDATFQN